LLSRSTIRIVQKITAKIFTKRRMMTPDYTKPPYSYYAPPGTIQVSAAALQMAREFGEQVARTKSNQVIAFDWAISRGVRRRVDGPMEELGPGLDLVSFEAASVPKEVIQRLDGLTFAIRIPKHVYDASTQRLIDVDETAFSKLVLR
jgi:hypothetical protein